MSNYTLSGSILKIDETQTFASGFSKREFVVETAHDKYPQQIKLEVVKDKCATLDQLDIGDQVTVEFDIRGNEHNGKYYVSLSAWKFSATKAAQPVPAPAKPAPTPVAAVDDGLDDIPF